MQLLPLKGYESLKALNAFHTLLLGLKMLPAYSLISYVEFFEMFQHKTEAEKETLIREAIVFVPLSEEEVLSLIGFAKDPNGIPFGKANLKNLNPKDLHETMVAVCMKIGEIRVDILSEDEKKKFQPSA